MSGLIRAGLSFVQAIRAGRALGSLAAILWTIGAGQLAFSQDDAASPRESAPVDLTGYWVSVVTEAWRWRMVVPGKGDYASIPLNEEGIRVADQWEPGTAIPGEECRPYGAAAIMRVPGRIHVTWEDDETLRIDTDAGMQTRLFHFGGEPPEDMEPAWQGYSSARWEPPPGGRAQVRIAVPLGAVGAGGNVSQWRSLEVVTTRLRPGYLRWNGVPYSADAVVREFYDVTPMPNGDTWLIVTTIVEDPLYLDIPYVTSTNFKKQADDSGWNPTPCTPG